MVRYQRMLRRKFQSRYHRMTRRIWMGPSIQQGVESRYHRMTRRFRMGHSIRQWSQWRSRVWYKATKVGQTGMRHQRVQRRFWSNLSVLATPVEDSWRQGEAMFQWWHQTAVERSARANMVGRNQLGGKQVGRRQWVMM